MAHPSRGAAPVRGQRLLALRRVEVRAAEGIPEMDTPQGALPCGMRASVQSSFKLRGILELMGNPLVRKGKEKLFPCSAVNQEGKERVSGASEAG